MDGFARYCRDVVLALLAALIIGVIAASFHRARADDSARPVPEVRVVCLVGTCGVLLPCALIKRAASPDFMRRLERDARGLPPGSALGDVRERFNEIVEACASRERR